MNIKSLLLGSAAALAVVSGAHAADAIVAAEPEPMEYVKVCDAFGAGYFYIPGTETCLKIGGYVRLEEQFGFNTPDTFDSEAGFISGYDDHLNGYARGYVSVLTAADTEMGVLKTNISFYGQATNAGSADDFVLDRAYIELGGFGMGYTINPFDDGIAGETDSLGGDDTTNFRTWYNFNAGSFAGNIGVDQFGTVGSDIGSFERQGFGISGKAGATFGAVTATLYGGYDFSTDEAAVEAMLAAAIGPGTLNLAGAYQSGDTWYFKNDGGEAWAIAASYEAKITDKLTLTPGVQYTHYEDFDADTWDAGALLAYQVTDGLTASLNVQYHNVNSDVLDTDYVDGWFRLQRDF
jgi:hypothetical protein